MMDQTSVHSPIWDKLYEIALEQEGYFTTQQAAEAGYSAQLLNHHLHAGRFIRVRRGVYRLVHFPDGEHEDLTEIWLWSQRTGVFSHQTALALHELSGVLPAKVHLTLPTEWRSRRLRVPQGVVVHYGDIGADERQWFGPVPVTAPLRSIEDCARSHLSPELVYQATRDALERGLVVRAEVASVAAALQPFEGLGL